MRVLTIIGTRPEALKLGPVLLEFARRPGVVSQTCLTGQHRDLAQPALASFGLHAACDLALMQPNQTPDEFLSRALVPLGRTIQQFSPDWVLGVGDTTSVLAASLAAMHQGARFAHIEAGLRSGDIEAPFPEELNRRLIAAAAQVHFAPTPIARQNLFREGIGANAIEVTGNPIIDAVRHFGEGRASTRDADAILHQLGLASESPARPALILVTLHRRENLGSPLVAIAAALRQIALQHHPDARLLCLVHPNPAAAALLHRTLGDTPGVHLHEPVDYPTLLALLVRSDLVLTDSGGLQEEAAYLGVPLLVARDTTERPEGVHAGLAQLVGSTPWKIVPAAHEILSAARQLPHRPRERFHGYGDGHAAPRIADSLQARLRRLSDAATCCHVA